jgi:hypothetical protein
MEKRIEFRAVDNGLMSTMERFKRVAQEAYVGLLTSSKEYSRSGQAQIQFIEQQVAVLEKRDKLESEYDKLIARRKYEQALAEAPTAQAREAAKARYAATISKITGEAREEDIIGSLLREQIETIKLTSKNEIAEDKKNVEKQVLEFNKLEKAGKLEQLDPEEVALRRLQRDQLQTDQQEKREKGRLGAFSGFLGGMMFDNIMRGLSSLPQARTEMDLMRPTGAALGAIAGGGIGMAVSAATLGQIEAEVVGARVGQAIGEIAAEAYVRHIETSDQLRRATFKLFGITGNRGISAPSLAQFGADRIEVAALMEQLINQGVLGVNQVSSITRDFLAAEKRYGLDRGYMMEAIGLGRMFGQEDFRITGARALEGGVAAGAFERNDRALMQVLLRNTNQLMQNLSGVVSNVDRNQLTATLLNFNAIGGQFGIRDPRSMGNIMQMQQAISQPSNEFLQAANFAAMRGIAPNAGLFDMLKMQEQGMANPEMVRAIMRQMSQLGGSEDFQKLALQRRFGLSYAATEELYKGREAIVSGRMTGEEIGRLTARGVETRAEFEAEAAALTTRLEKRQAKITDAFIISATEGIKKVNELYFSRMAEETDNVAAYFVEKFKEAIDETKTTFKEGLKENPIFYSPLTGVVKNPLYNPSVN